MIAHARAHKVIILQFPPHLTHVLQPLDALFFKILKAEIRRSKSSKKIEKVKDKWDVLDFLCSPLQRTSTIDTIRDSFRIAGTWPPRYKEECIVNKSVPLESILKEHSQEPSSTSPPPSNLNISLSPQVQFSQTITSITGSQG